MFLQWVSMAGTLTQFLLGATLGVAMNFWDALIAVTLGGLILEVAFLALGYAGLREGMGTNLLARWVAFGSKGSALVSLIACATGVGWFGIQNQVFAESLGDLTGVDRPVLWSVLAAALVTLVATYGFKYMTALAYIAVPAFIGLLVYIMVVELQTHSFAAVISAPPTGEPLTLTAAITIVAGSKMVGVLGGPDHCRYNKRMTHVAYQTTGHIVVGHYFTMMVGVWLAKVVASDNVSQIVLAGSGLFGLVILILSVVKVNDWNIYNASLGLTNFIHVIFGRRVHRGVVSVALGAVGAVLSILGVLNHFRDWLTILGTAVTPVCAILIAEYLVVRRFREPLDRTRELETLPETAPKWVPATYVVWALGFLIAQFVTWGIPAVTSLVATFVLYLVASALKLVRGVGVERTVAEPPAKSAVAP